MLFLNLLPTNKKSLQSKIWELFASGNHIDGSQNTSVKKDCSTSTEDMDGASERSNIDMQFTGSLPGVQASSSTQLPRDAESILEITSISIPADQMGTIDNMNVLISKVVERVLGWIMKLFPGGPLSTASERRTSKLI